MSKKKHRNIVVNGTEYAWAVVGNNHIRIWKDGKTVLEAGTKADAITPKNIRNIIVKEKL